LIQTSAEFCFDICGGSLRISLKRGHLVDKTSHPSPVRSILHPVFFGPIGVAVWEDVFFVFCFRDSRLLSRVQRSMLANSSKRTILSPPLSKLPALSKLGPGMRPTAWGQLSSSMSSVGSVENEIPGKQRKNALLRFRCVLKKAR